jgi:tol-pal system protein YbgF
MSPGAAGESSSLIMEMKLNRTKFASLFLLACLLVLSNCATQGDLDSVQRDANNTTKEMMGLQRNIYDLNAELKDLSGRMQVLEKRTGETSRQVSGLTGEVKSKVGFLEKEMETSSQPMRKYQADLGARLDKLQLDVQNLTGRLEESKYYAEKTFGATKNTQTRIEDLEKRVAALQKSVESVEKNLDTADKKIVVPGGQATAQAEKAEEEKPVVSPPPAETAKGQPSAKRAQEKPAKAASGPEEAYKRAYDKYTKGDLEGARKDFKKFLETYPKSKYSENAHFWLGECYFAGKKYEEAILEFDEVIKNYPKGNKVPDSLFRQGMAFLEMKDTTNAKLILKEVVRRFPQTDQASRARKKLKEIG